MTKTRCAALGLLMAVAGATSPAAAQERPAYRFDMGLNGGFAWYSDILDDDHLGEDAEDVKFESGWIAGFQATWWAHPRVGIRGNITYSERPLVLGSFDELNANDESTNLLEDINLWSATADLLLRPLATGHPVGGWTSMPYLALGIGAKNVNPVGDVVLNPDAPESEQETGAYFRTPDQGTGPGEFFLVSESKMLGLAALGTDLRVSDHLGIRLELGDRFWDGTLRHIEEFAINPDEDLGNVVHELYATIGAHMLVGLETPPVVAVAPAPPTRPSPRPEPQPQPDPVEERITVCVIDPGATGGLRNVGALYRPAIGDTFVVAEGVRRPLSETIPRVQLASEADWFVRGEPLRLMLAQDYLLEYTTWRAAVQIEPAELEYLGSIRGLPVYASREEVADVIGRVREASREAGSDDLATVLPRNEALHADFEDIQYLYVPLQPTGCVFQTVQLVPQVRKKE